LNYGKNYYILCQICRGVIWNRGTFFKQSCV